MEEVELLQLPRCVRVDIASRWWLDHRIVEPSPHGLHHHRLVSDVRGLSNAILIGPRVQSSHAPDCPSVLSPGASPARGSMQQRVACQCSPSFVGRVDPLNDLPVLRQRCKPAVPIWCYCPSFQAVLSQLRHHGFLFPYLASARVLEFPCHQDGLPP
eukprot:1303712-Rhodomonas_salina.2